MGFRKDKTGIAQTAANNAGTVVAALVTAGVITDVATAKTEFAAIQAEVYDVLAPIVDADNALFEEVEKSAPAPKPRGGSGGGSRSSGSSGGSSTVTLDQARGVALGFGKFGSKDDDGNANGVTLGALEDMSASDCKEYGYESGNGIKYLEYLSRNENNSFIARRAQVILDARKASSDE